MKAKTFICEHCHKPGQQNREGTLKFHRKCYHESLRTGRATIACTGCKKPVIRKDNKNGRCATCDRLHRTGLLGKPLDVQLLELLKKDEQTPRTLAEITTATPGQVLDKLLELQHHGHNVHNFGELWSLEKVPQTGGIIVPALESDKDGWYAIGFVSDTHLCSVHERLDVLNDLYNIFEANGITRVMHSGNYIDGEARFNRFELLVHGMDRQLQYLGEHYPQRKGIETWAVSGDDHEGWYCQREGVDIGRYAEDVMRRGGRTDWKNLGYMEAFVPLTHKETGKTSRYHVMHPGGGTAYATSYTVQKIVEGYEGGEKPAVLQAGHYHKIEFINIRNVWCLQPGCVMDQTVFARKKKITFSVGGGIIYLRQNPETGAIEEAVPFIKHYFNRGYYENNRWSLSGPITKVPRLIA
jgi:hypothetical protein